MINHFLALILTIRPDFIQHFEAGKMLNLGLNPYLKLLTSIGPFNYPPTPLPFYRLLALLPINSAAILWNVLSILSLIISVFLLIKITKLKLKIWHYLIIYLLVFLSFPVKFSLGMGQTNHFVLLFLTLGLYFSFQKKLKFAGIFLGIATAYKLSPGLILIFLIIKKDWKTIGWIVVTILFLLTFSLLAAPFNFQKVYYTDVFFRAFSIGGKEVYYNQALSGFIYRTFSNLDIFSRQIILWIGQITILIVSLIRFKKVNQYLQWSIIFSSMILLNSLSWQHHLVFLIPCMVLIYKSGGLWKKICLVVAYILVSTNIPNPQNYRGFASLILSHGFYGALLIWFLSLKSFKSAPFNQSKSVSD